MPWVHITVRTERHADHTVVQQHRRPLILSQRIEWQLPSHGPIADSRYNGLKNHWAAKFLGPCSDVQRVQPLLIAGSAPNDLHRLGNHVKSATSRIDYWSAGNANLRHDIATLPRVACRNG